MTPKTPTDGRFTAVAPSGITPCFALKFYTYDFYEWEKTVAVAEDVEKLRAFYTAINHKKRKAPLVSDAEHEVLKDDGMINKADHWTIEPIVLL